MIAVVDEVAEQQLDPRSVDAERVTRGIASTIFAAGSLVGLILALLFGGLSRDVKIVMLVGWMLLAAWLTLSALWWPSVRFRYTWYSLGPREFRIRRGVVWRSVTSIPRSRVQHTDVSRGPIERAFGLATLVIYTAGTQHASVSLGGLPHERAAEIRDRLIESGQSDRGDAV